MVLFLAGDMLTYTSVALIILPSESCCQGVGETLKIAGAIDERRAQYRLLLGSEQREKAQSALSESLASAIISIGEGMSALLSCPVMALALMLDRPFLIKDRDSWPGKS
jgi:hypothetical protein